MGSTKHIDGIKFHAFGDMRDLRFKLLGDAF